MQIDKVTLNDLSIFHEDAAASVFHQLDNTRTVAGRTMLRKLFANPLTSLDQIQATQATLKRIITKQQEWPLEVTNGSIQVIERYYDSVIDPLPSHSNSFDYLLYRIFHSHDYFLLRFSIPHMLDFLKSMRELTLLLDGSIALPRNLHYPMQRARELLADSKLNIVWNTSKGAKPSGIKLMNLAHFYLYNYRDQMLELVDTYALLDAYYSMAIAVDKKGLTFPDFEENELPKLEVKGLFHPLLEAPVAYDVRLDPHKNFLFLTGANMAGKSTFIKAVGIAAYLAHLGMAVPALHMQLSMFNGILSNIQVADNILKGESYFFNEVQRIKNTISTISDSRKWLILIDELFKGTNVEDAMKCSLTVIQGLVKVKHSIFILSTHLYEISELLQPYTNINFKFFETTVNGDQLAFSYLLKDGVSSDRIGYLILRREKVVEMLEQLK